MDNIEWLNSEMTRTVGRNLLKYAAGRQMFCPKCSKVLDAKTTVLITYREQERILCAQCWGRNPMTVKSGAVDIMDGRVFWPAKQPKLKPYKHKEVA